MKISTLYLNDISEYEDISEYLYQQVKKYYGVGVNSISISRLISLFKKILKTYIKLKYQKNIKLIITIPKIDEKIVNNDDMNNNIVKLRLSYNNVVNILNGIHTNLSGYVDEIIEQLDIELTSNNKFSFINYLTIQMDMLCDISINELKSTYETNLLKEMIVKKDSWIKLSQQSSIFKDYYISYMENPNNKKLFFSFLRGLIQKI